MELCSTDTVSGLDKLLQLHVMMSLCCDSEFNYMLQSVGYVLLILKVMYNKVHCNQRVIIGVGCLSNNGRME